MHITDGGVLSICPRNIIKVQFCKFTFYFSNIFPDFLFKSLINHLLFATIVFFKVVLILDQVSKEEPPVLIFWKALKLYLINGMNVNQNLMLNDIFIMFCLWLINTFWIYTLYNFYFTNLRKRFPGKLLFFFSALKIMYHFYSEV